MMSEMLRNYRLGRVRWKRESEQPLEPLRFSRAKLDSCIKLSKLLRFNPASDNALT